MGKLLGVSVFVTSLLFESWFEWQFDLLDMDTISNDHYPWVYQGGSIAECCSFEFLYWVQYGCQCKTDHDRDIPCFLCAPVTSGSFSWDFTVSLCNSSGVV